MLLRAANLWVSSTMNFINDGEFLGMISRADKSSTNLTRVPHVRARGATLKVGGLNSDSEWGG